MEDHSLSPDWWNRGPGLPGPGSGTREPCLRSIDWPFTKTASKAGMVCAGKACRKPKRKSLHMKKKKKKGKV